MLVGTEAVLHRLAPADGVGAVAFLDFDQELLAARVRAGEEALALLAHAARLVGGRAGRVLVQTRLPDHPAVRAALLADPGIAGGRGARTPRATLRLPPVTAIAIVSGPAAGAYVAGLAGPPLGGPRSRPGSVAGQGAGHRRPGRRPGRRPPPAGRLRVAVDPVRF